MATYYKYAKRSAEDYVDWGAIGKTMSDTLLKEQANRDKMKADIDKASREFGEVLSNAPQGSHRGLNEYAQEFGSNAQEYQLMQLKNLKSGKLSLKDYLVGRENVKQGANDAFDLIKKYNDAFTENDQRLNEGISSAYETWMLGEVEGFGNLTSTSLYINPTDGKVSAGRRVLRDPSKPYDPTTNPYTAQMSSDPSNFRSLVDLNFALSAKIDKYDSKGTISSIAETFADTYETVTERGARGAYTKVSDIRNLGKDGEEFEAALKQKLIADFRTNKIHTISSLVDWLKVGPDGEPIGFTRNPEEANEHTILLKANPSQPEGGTDIMDEDAPGATELLDHLMEQVGNSVMSELNRKIEVKQGYRPVVRGGGSGQTQEETMAYKYFEDKTKEIRMEGKHELTSEELEARKTPTNPTGGPTTRELREYARNFGVEFTETGDAKNPYMIGGEEYPNTATVDELIDVVESLITDDKANILTGWKRKKPSAGGVDSYDDL